MEAMLQVECFQDIKATFHAPIVREHRIEHGRAVGVKADPVVREDRVGCVRLWRVIEHMKTDACRCQRIRKSIEFRACCFLDCIAVLQITALLKAIRCRCLFVPGELHGSDHQDMRGGLRFRHWKVAGKSGGQYIGSLGIAFGAK